MPWVFVLVGVLLVILGAHDRIARAIGTAAPTQAGTVTSLSTTANPPVTLLSTGATAAVQAVAPLPNRAPRDPFQALVSEGGSRLAVVALPVTKGDRHGTTPGAPKGGSAAGTGNCTDNHVVRSGESLWSIAQQHVNETGHGTTAHYWHRIYSANAHSIGANPGQISIGLRLCLPSP